MLKPDYAVIDSATLELAEAILAELWLGGADDVPEPGTAGWVEGVALVALRLVEDGLSGPGQADLYAASDPDAQ